MVRAHHQGAGPRDTWLQTLLTRVTNTLLGCGEMVIDYLNQVCEFGVGPTCRLAGDASPNITGVKVLECLFNLHKTLGIGIFKFPEDVTKGSGEIPYVLASGWKGKWHDLRKCVSGRSLAGAQVIA